LVHNYTTNKISLNIWLMYCITYIF
jgi:hypothetical protein